MIITLTIKEIIILAIMYFFLRVIATPLPKE